MNRLKSIALFLASPFIALAYIIALPFVGLYMFISLTIEAVHEKYSEDVKDVLWKKYTSTHYQ